MVLMVPVSAFAAVVAMAGPQRLAAESSMDEAADDMAVLAVAWRDGQRADEGPVPAFPPECSNQGLQTRFDEPIEWLKFDISARQIQIENLPSGDPNRLALEQQQVGDRAELTRQNSDLVQRQQEWLDICEFLLESLIRDLGNLGVDINSLRGFYSASLTTADSLDPSDPPNTKALPCQISPRAEVRDAVHVALTADWVHAGWAAAQVWPDGTRMGAESIGRLRRSVSNSALSELCGKQLDVLDSQGQPVWLDDDPNTDPNIVDSRRLSQSVPGRTAIEG